MTGMAMVTDMETLIRIKTKAFLIDKAILERVDDETVPLDGDQHDGHGRQVHGQGEGREDDAAERLAEDPLVGQLIVELQRQAEEAETKIRDGEIDDEHVGHRLALLRSGSYEDDDAVAHQTDDDDDDVDDDDQTPYRRHLDQIQVPFRVDARPVRHQLTMVQPIQLLVGQLGQLVSFHYFNFIVLAEMERIPGGHRVLE